MARGGANMNYWLSMNFHEWFSWMRCAYRIDTNKASCSAAKIFSTEARRRGGCLTARGHNYSSKAVRPPPFTPYLRRHINFWLISGQLYGNYMYALQGQKPKHIVFHSTFWKSAHLAFALTGRVFPSSYKTQGAALGYELIGPTGRSNFTCESWNFWHTRGMSLRLITF